jgi:hypothetical protein
MERGARAVVTRREAGMRWTRMVRPTSAVTADGKGVWSWHPDAGAKLASDLAGDGGKKARFPGESAL